MIVNFENIPGNGMLGSILVKNMSLKEEEFV